MPHRLLSALLALALALAPFSARATDLNQTDWSESDTNNNGTPPNGWPSGTMLPSQVEPAARAIRGAVKRFYDHAGPTIASGGTANAQTLTYATAPAAYVAGDLYVFTVQGTTSPTTNASSAAGTNTVTVALLPQGAAAGWSVLDVTNPAAIPAGTTVSSISGTTLTLSANIVSPGVSNGDTLALGSNLTNSGAATLNVNGIAAKNIFIGTQPLSGGELVANTVAAVYYDGTEFQLASVPSPQPNLIYNPSAELDMRNEGAAITASATYAVDGWKSQFSTAASSLQYLRSSDSSCRSQNSVKALVVTGSATVGAGDYLTVQQPIEAGLLGGIGFGAAGAVPLSLQYCAKSNLTGTFAFALRNAAATRSFVNTCALAANVWTRCSFEIPGDTAGSWVLSGTASGMTLDFTGEAGSTLQCSPGVWFAGSCLGTSAQTQMTQTSGAFLEVTSIKLEVSPIPTPFARRAVGEELRLAQRYYQKSYDIGTAPGAVTEPGNSHLVVAAGGTLGGVSQPFRVTMRCDPAVATYSDTGAGSRARDYTNAADVIPNVLYAGNSGFLWQASPSAGSNINIGLQWTAECGL